ncbi:threonine synthase [Chelativorans xinjiangense]|uniref:threonine synthase n=1 Tax=Chelativorans xinjiangense TaxID=2681485 RepID=UPI001356F6FC|nr:threonine synthase [Chelativorans xinjiangense]
MSRMIGYSCIRCGTRHPADYAIDSRGCLRCFDKAPANLQVVYDEAGRHADGGGLSARVPTLWHHADMLPCAAGEAVSLGEGLTPLLPVPALGQELGVPNLLVKDEGRNPTWSHKDRFSTVAVSMARLQGARVVATASSGNAGASLAAYAARAGLSCVVVTFAGTAGPMLTQIRKYGATVVALSEKADRWPLVAEGVRRLGWFATSPFHAPVVGSHPIGIEGYKTLAPEIVEQMGGKVPDWCVLPVCYGDALFGLWEGFKELHRRRTIDHLPRLLAAEVHGSLAAALAAKEDPIPDMPARFDTLAVSIGATRSTFQALKALRESNGAAVPVNNSGLIALQERLAAREGIFAELASVTPFAAIAEMRRRNVIAASDSVVALVTASGLKDVDRSSDAADAPPAFRSLAEAWAYLSRDEALCAAKTATA